GSRSVERTGRPEPLDYCVDDRIEPCCIRRQSESDKPVRWVLPIICLLVAGCSLPTISLPTGSASAEEQVGGGILRIAVSKGDRADCASADERMLVKAAEAAQRVGGSHFMLLPGHGGSPQLGYAYVRVFTLGADECAPSRTISVEEAVQF